MNREILVFDKSREAGEALASGIRYAYRRLSGAKISVRDPQDVFTGRLPDNPRAAFFAVTGMYEAEAARKFHAMHGDVPIIIVSDSAEYGVWSWRLGTSCYLKRPLTAEDLTVALKKCVKNKPFVASY